MKHRHVGVVGAGSFGRHHVRHLCAHPRVGRVTIIDRDQNRADSVAKAHGAATAASVDELDLDAAVVVVPTESHFAVAAPLLERGIPCLIEKPVTGTTRDGESLNAIAARAGTFVQVGHIERFSGAFEALAAGAGPVRHIAARRHNPARPVPPVADVVLDLMIHDIDLVLTLAASRVTGLEAFAPDGTGQEAVSARLTFASGAVAEISASRLAPVMERSLVVHDAGGVWHADLAQKSLHRFAGGALSEIEIDRDRDSLALEIDEFIAAVDGRQNPRVDGVAGLAALRVANEIRAALSPVSLQLSA